MNWSPVALPNDGHRCCNNIPASTLCEIGFDQALHPLLESSLQLRPFVVKDGKHDTVANVTGPGKTVPAQDTFPDSATLGHGHLATLVPRINLHLHTRRTPHKDADPPEHLRSHQ